MRDVDLYYTPFNNVSVANGQRLTDRIPLDGCQGFLMQIFCTNGASTNIALWFTNTDRHHCPPGLDINNTAYMRNQFQGALDVNGNDCFWWSLAGTNTLSAHYWLLDLNVTAPGNITAIVNVKRCNNL